MIQDWRKISRSSQPTIAKVQNEQLQFLIKHLLPYHPFYRQLFKSKKVNLEWLRSVEELPRVPFSSKIDILPTEENPGKTKDFILQPNEDLIRKHYPKSALIKLLLTKATGGDAVAPVEYEFKPIHIHFTTGRSSSQIPFLYSQRDLDLLGETTKRFFDVIGANKSDILINAFPFAPHLAFWFGYNASPGNGLLALHTGGGKMMGTQKIMDSIEKLKGTMLSIMPGYCYHLMKEAVEQKKDFSSLKFVLLGGERINPGLREKLKEMLKEVGASNAKVLSTYAFTEAKTAWVQCHEDSGYHLYPDLEFIELVDEDGNRVKEGAPGEVVYTALDWRGSMVFRYKTGDYAKSLTYSRPCKYCGRTSPQLHYDIERKSENVALNLTKVKGEFVNLNTFHTVIHKVKGIDEWQVEIKKNNNDKFDLDELFVHISLRPNANKEEAIIELKTLIHNEMGVSPIIEEHDQKELIQMLGLDSELKEKRIVDRRKETK